MLWNFVFFSGLHGINRLIFCMFKGVGPSITQLKRQVGAIWSKMEAL